MARVTVEDCLKNVKNRFELVAVAAKRARQLMRGKEAKVEWDNDKATVVALREIAAGYTQFNDAPTDENNEGHHIAPTLLVETQETTITFTAPEPESPQETHEPKESTSE